MLKKGAERGELVNIALNTHGTRAVQKLIETLSSREQRQIVIQALEGGEMLVDGGGGSKGGPWRWESVGRGGARRRSAPQPLRREVAGLMRVGMLFSI